MFVIPVNLPLTLFLLGAAFGGALATSTYVSWLEWLIGVLLAVLRWRTIRSALRILWTIYHGHYDLFDFDDICLVRLINHTSSYWNMTGLWESGTCTSQCLKVETHGQSCLKDLLNIGTSELLSEKSHVLLIGCGCAEEAIYLCETFGCSVSCVDVNFEKVQIGNDQVSGKRLWNKVRVNSMESLCGIASDAGNFDVIFALAPSAWYQKRQFHEDLAVLTRLTAQKSAIYIQGLILSPPAKWSFLQHLIPEAIQRRCLTHCGMIMDLEDRPHGNLSAYSFELKNLSADFILLVSALLKNAAISALYLSFWRYAKFTAKLLFWRSLVTMDLLKFVSIRLEKKESSK